MTSSPIAYICLYSFFFSFFLLKHVLLLLANIMVEEILCGATLLLFLFYFLNSKCIRVSGFLRNCRIRVSVFFRYRYTYPHPCNLAHENDPLDKDDSTLARTLHSIFNFLFCKNKTCLHLLCPTNACHQKICMLDS